MVPARYPWRVVAVAAISLIGNAYLGYYLLFGLASDGVGLQVRAGRVAVTEVDENTAAARAGIQAGDHILKVNKQRIVTVIDWMAQREALKK